LNLGLVGKALVVGVQGWVEKKRISEREACTGWRAVVVMIG
jgi:hypothetical protein